MNRISILLSCVCFIFISQKAISQDTLKTSAKSWTAEININPFQGQISLNNTLNQIKVRYFRDNNFAYRLAFSLTNTRIDNGSTSAYGVNPINNTDEKRSTSFGVNLGFEKHLSGTRRLSPYIGGEIAFGIKRSRETIDTNESTTDYKGGWKNTQTYIYNNNYYTYSNYSEQGYYSFGLNVVTGFDFYIAKHLFVGYEMLFGFNYINYTDIESTITPKTTQTYYSEPTQSAKERSFGPKIINGIRLGYTF